MISLTIFLISLIAAVTNAASCPGHGMLDANGTTCYIVNPVFLPFHRAIKGCAERFGKGYKLAKIQSSDINQMLYNDIKSVTTDNANTFFGATDDNKDNTWEWVDGTKMEYHNWALANRLGGCASMRELDGKWIRDDCDTHQPSFCSGPAIKGNPKFN